MGLCLEISFLIPILHNPQSTRVSTTPITPLISGANHFGDNWDDVEGDDLIMMMVAGRAEIVL